jgi:hypothetical protein
MDTVPLSYSPRSKLALEPASKPADRFTPYSRFERGLLWALLIAVLAACLGPHVAQHAHYHGFADQRAWFGIPFAMDVLSNLPFTLAGVWGLVLLWLGRHDVARRSTPRALAGLFFVGLLVTTACSSFYHFNPQDSSLALDRQGMVVAFAGLLGLAAADRVSARMGLLVAALVLVAGPLAVAVWQVGGNLLPWAILQGGGMVLLVVLAMRKPCAGALGVPWMAVIALYAVAKLFELGDASVFGLMQGWVSGHSLKHVLAALAAGPVIWVMHNRAKVAGQPQ